MKKGMFAIVVVVILLFTSIIILGIYKFNFTTSDLYNENGTQINVHDGTYKIDGAPVTLVNGNSEQETAPGSASKTITRYFGNDAQGDFNADGRKDTAFLLTQETGGSGTFYYLVALLDTENGKTGTEAFFLGDRIAPQTTELRSDGTLVVNYAERNPGEGFDMAPSLGKSLYVRLDPVKLQFFEVVHNSENTTPSTLTDQASSTTFSENDARAIAERECIKGGEALSKGYYNENSKTWWFDANLNATQEGCNPACVVSETTKTAEINWRCTGLKTPENTSSLEMKKWTWTDDPNGRFTLTFTNDGRVSIGTDCNSMGGSYTATESTLSLSNLMSTEMYCEGSREQEFSSLLQEVTGYTFRDSGELVLFSNTNPELLIFK